MSRPAVRLPDRARTALASPGSLAESCPAGATALRALDALLFECLRTGASRLHVEIDGHGVRARVRRDGALESRRLDLGHPDAPGAAIGALDAALEACLDSGAGGAAPSPAEQRRHFTCAVGIEAAPVRVSFDRVGDADRASAVFELTPWPGHAPTLDELVDDVRELAALRAALASAHGLILVVGTDPVALGALADAVAQQCVAPDRKVVRACGTVRRALPGVVQLGCAPGAHDCDAAMLGQDADVIVVDDGPSRAALTAVTERAAARALVVRTLAGGNTIDALRTLAAEGTGPTWLSHRLRAIVRLDRLRTLCPHCRQPLDVSAHGTAAATSTLPTPLSRALAGSLQRPCEAPGCARCAGTGIERSAHAIEVLPVLDGIAAALADGAIADAAEALDAGRGLPGRARELARRGLVSMEEAARLDAR